jgi:hypothetical protein
MDTKSNVISGPFKLNYTTGKLEKIETSPDKMNLPRGTVLHLHGYNEPDYVITERDDQEEESEAKGGAEDPERCENHAENVFIPVTCAHTKIAKTARKKRPLGSTLKRFHKAPRMIAYVDFTHISAIPAYQAFPRTRAGPYQGKDPYQRIKREHTRHTRYAPIPGRMKRLNYTSYICIHDNQGNDP